MNYTEKRLEEFDREFVKDCGPDVEPIFICAVGSVGPIRQFLSESITQAIAEERERVMGEIDRLKRNPKRDIVYCLSYELALNDLLSSLDNPDKE